MKPCNLAYSRPRTIDQAVEHLTATSSDTKIIAGGQSLMPMLNLRMVAADRLIDVTAIESLKEHADLGSAVRLGACITHDEIASGSVPDPTRGLMKYVGARIAYQAVRNRGTLGGSLALADPAADWVTTMALLGASITCHGVQGAREIAAEDFVVGPYMTGLDAGDLLTSITIPTVASEAAWGTYKLCRKTGEFAHAMATVLRMSKHSRAFLGATDGAPIRLPLVAGVLDGMAEWRSDYETPIHDAFEADINAVDCQLNDIRVRQSRTCLVRAIKMSFGMAPKIVECA